MHFNLNIAILKNFKSIFDMLMIIISFTSKSTKTKFLVNNNFHKLVNFLLYDLCSNLNSIL